jgi:hypothetical protein
VNEQEQQEAKAPGELRIGAVNMSHDALLALLDDVREHVAAGDSFEGSLEYLLPFDDDAPPRSFDVRASYRVGNLQGQGGMRMIGEVRDGG